MINLAKTMQITQDWITQQWVILTGKKVDAKSENWILGPFGEENGIGEKFMIQLSEKENLEIIRDDSYGGLLSNFKDLISNKKDESKIHPEIIRFYQNTSDYNLDFKVNWNPFFKPFGILVNLLFSKRIHQLNIPVNSNQTFQRLSNDIITLRDKITKEIRYTIWLRKTLTNNTVVYAGIYSITKKANGNPCVKTIFPLPNGSATVILDPYFKSDNEFELISKGTKVGDAGFYFLLEDSRNTIWMKYIPSFTDTLRIIAEDNQLFATQVLKLWKMKVLQFDYRISRK